MAFTSQQTLEIIEAMENFLSRKRPPEHIRPQLDINYRIDESSIVIFTVRPHWNDTDKKLEMEIAKSSYVKSKNIWKVYWKRSDNKWHSYKPIPEVISVHEFTLLVEEDQHHCFWG